MKPKSIRLTINLLTLVFVLFLSINSSQNIKFNAEKKVDNLGYNKDLKSSAVSGKIHINGNSEWIAFKNDGNCSGEGIYSNPYVIEDLVIDGEGSGSCILIENSSVYFRIENCTLRNSGPYSDAGIKLSYVINSQLINNNCSSNGGKGISLSYSNNNTISENAVENNSEFGISLSWSNYNTISGNIVNNNEQSGIQLYSSVNNSVSGNTANSNIFSGIHLYKSDNNIILGNNATSNTLYGISSDEINNNNITGNTANSNDKVGIYLYDSKNISLLGNTANNNSDYGISLSSSDYNTISGNTANNNSIGISLFSSDYNTVSKNILQGNSKCIMEENCIGNTFQNNDYCDYGEGIPFEVIFIISSISGGAVIGIASLLLIRRKRKRI